MINEENLDKLYNGVIETTELTTKQLNGFGFNSKDLNDLIKKGSIERIKRGVYSLKSIDALYYYGTKLLVKKEYDKATLCFEKCLELDPQHLLTCFQLFIRSISNKDYKRAFELYDKLSKTDNKYYKIDNNYYLYLLSIITELPEESKRYARYLNLNDIRILDSDTRYDDIAEQNKIRQLALQRKFTYALAQLKALNNKHGYITRQEILEKQLLYQAICAENLSKNTIVNLIREKEYKEVINYLSKKQYRHNLNTIEKYVLNLANIISEIKETKVIPKPKVLQSETLFDAINNSDFNLALKLNTEFNEENHINCNTNPINLLLNDICSLIRELLTAKKDKTNTLNSNLSQELPTFQTVISLLMKNDLDNAFYILGKYMETISKSEYEFLIVDLIKISMLEKDFEFKNTIAELTLLGKENYVFDISNYIQNFFTSLSEDRFEEARIYLDIISKSKRVGQECIIIDDLYHILESSKKVIKSKIKTEAIAPKDETKVEKIEVSKPIKIDKTSEGKYALVIKETIDNIKRFIEGQYHKLLKNKGSILLKHMDSKRINIVLEIIKEYKDISAFVIEDEKGAQRVVLKYNPIINESIDIKGIISASNKAYSHELYDDCIAGYKKLLQLFQKPKASIYGKIGLAYMKKKKIKVAINYLTIATGISKKNNANYDFSNLIFKLKGETPDDDIKPAFEMEVTDFNTSYVNNYYGIENFDDINNYIIKSKLDVESACQQMGMTPEQTDIIKLIYAKEFYIQGYEKQGQLFLKSFEQSRNKTETTIKVFKEINRNKRLYENAEENPKQLVLTIKPNKN